MKKHVKATLLLMAILFPAWAVSQTVISGQVIESGTCSPLPGASIFIKATSKSTQSEAEGKFSFPFTGSNQKLAVSYNGYLTQMVNAANNVIISLTVDNTNLGDVVVTELATSLKRGNLANAVASISSKDQVGITIQSTIE